MICFTQIIKVNYVDEQAKKILNQILKTSPYVTVCPPITAFVVRLKRQGAVLKHDIKGNGERSFKIKCQ